MNILMIKNIRLPFAILIAMEFTIIFSTCVFFIFSADETDDFYILSFISIFSAVSIFYCVNFAIGKKIFIAVPTSILFVTAMIICVLLLNDDQDLTIFLFSLFPLIAMIIVDLASRNSSK